MNITVVRSLKLFVLYCSSSFNAEDLNNAIHAEDGDDLRIVGLPCSGKIDQLYLVKAFEKGADGLVLLTCPRGKCHNFEGNLRALKRSEGVNSIMEETGLGKERMTVIALKEDGLDGIASEIALFSRKIRHMALDTAVNYVPGTSAVSC